jgi:glycosyltransferase involved in cell wall biosynthesis
MGSDPGCVAMNILHIATSFTRGGAANSLRLLHHALREAGHGSRVLAGRPTPPLDGVETLPPMPLWSRVPYHGLNLLGLNYAGIPTTGRIAKHPWFAWADVVHYHNLHGGYFNYLALPALTRAKPSVWTLRDMWALTGHCANSFGCERWRSGCGKCPHPEIDPPIRRDATNWELRLKAWSYQRSRMLVTAPSQWLTDLAQKSILKTFPICQVHNAVDTECYRPRDRQTLRSELGWPGDKIVMLFSAESVRNPFKHFSLLIEALQRLPDSYRENMVLAILGDGGDIPPLGIPMLALGYHDRDEVIARFYGAADFFVFPTRADNQPRVLLEAMACSCTPVATDVGGVSELVRHNETGILTPAGDAEALLLGIQRLVDYPEERLRMGINGRHLAVERHSIPVHLECMLDVYRKAREDRLVNIGDAV